MLALGTRGSRRHVIDAHLAGPGGGRLLGLLLIATRWLASAGGVETALLRLVYLLPHKASEHCSQHLRQHKPYKQEKNDQRKREAHELSEK